MSNEQKAQTNVPGTKCLNALVSTAHSMEYWASFSLKGYSQVINIHLETDFMLELIPHPYL